MAYIEGLRVIRSAFGEEDINKAVLEGYFPLIQWVHQNNHRLRVKTAVFQHKVTGEIYVSHDLRDVPPDHKYEGVIDYQQHYPYRRTSPIGAYLIPKVLQEGERVYLEEVLDDLVGEVSSQGDFYRLRGCTAVFLGYDKGFAIEYDESDVVEVIG